MAPELPGYTYDEDKKKYFKIVNGSSQKSTGKYHNNAVQKKHRKYEFVSQQELLPRKKGTHSNRRSFKKSEDLNHELSCQGVRERIRPETDPLSLKLGLYTPCQSFMSRYKTMLLEKNFKLIGEMEIETPIQFAVICELDISEDESIEILSTRNVSFETTLQRISNEGYFTTDEAAQFNGASLDTRLGSLFLEISDTNTIEFPTFCSFPFETSPGSTRHFIISTYLLNSPRYGSISIILLEHFIPTGVSIESAEDIMYTAKIDGDRGKIDELFGLGRFEDDPINSMVKSNDGGLHVTFSHISTDGTLFLGTNRGDLVTVPLLTVILSKPEICIRNYFHKSPIDFIKATRYLAILSSRGNCILMNKQPDENNLYNSQRLEFQHGSKVTNVFFWKEFFIVVGLKNVTKYDYKCNASEDNIKFEYKNETNQFSCVFEYDFGGVVGKMLIVTESGNSLRVYDIQLGSSVCISIDIPSSATLKSMVLIQNRLRLYYSIQKENDISRTLVREYELLQHYRDDSRSSIA